MPELRLSRSHFPVTVLGPGLRIGLWVQGCTIGCDGCISRDTWDPAGGVNVGIPALADWCNECIAAGATGLTVSGGEPFQQPEGFANLLRVLRGITAGSDFDVLAYSGYSHRYLAKNFADLVALVDVLVTEPYAAGSGPGGWLRGSANQRIVRLSELAQRRYPADRDVQLEHPAVQLEIRDGTVWYIGIPRPGDMARLEDFARQHGVELGGASWLA